MATRTFWKHWGRHFFAHGLETAPTQTASVGNLHVQSGYIVEAVTSLAGLTVSSLSTLRNMIANAASSLTGVNAASLSTLRDLTVSAVGSVARIFVQSNAGLSTVNSNATSATVSTSVVRSNSAIILTIQESYGSNVFVSSKVDGVSFAVNIGAADANFQHTVAWSLLN